MESRREGSDASSDKASGYSTPGRKPLAFEWSGNPGDKNTDGLKKDQSPPKEGEGNGSHEHGLAQSDNKSAQSDGGPESSVLSINGIDIEGRPDGAKIQPAEILAPSKPNAGLDRGVPSPPLGPQKLSVQAGGSASSSAAPPAKSPKPGEEGWVPSRRPFRSNNFQGGAITEGSLKPLMPRDLNKARNSSNQTGSSAGRTPQPPTNENKNRGLWKRLGVERSVDFSAEGLELPSGLSASGPSARPPYASGEIPRSSEADKDEESESEEDRLSEESGSEDRLSEESGSEDEDHPMDSLELHPGHVRSWADQRLSSKRFMPVKPFKLERKYDAHQLAARYAADSPNWPHVSQSPSVKCTVITGKLLGAANDFTFAIDLITAGVGHANAVLPDGQDVTVITLVIKQELPRIPEGTEKMAQNAPSADSSAEGPELRKSPDSPCPDAEYSVWVLHCERSALASILTILSENGGFRQGIAKTFEPIEGSKTASGSFGSVVHAKFRDVEKSPHVALKLLKESVKERCTENEVRMLVLASGHRNVIKFFGCFYEFIDKVKPPRWSISFEYHPRGDLYDRVAEGRRMMEDTAMVYMHGLLSALKHLQECEIFHRDIKPENILLDDSEKVVLTDFGIAVLTTDTAEMRKPTGTVGYASPEMLLGCATGFEGDLFGAGIVLYFMLSRSTPFLAPSRPLMVEKTHACKVNLNYSVFEHMSHECRTMMLSLITKNPKERMTLQQALDMRCLAPKAATRTEPVLPSVVAKPPKMSDPGVRDAESVNAAQAHDAHHERDPLSAAAQPFTALGKALFKGFGQ